MTKKITTNSSFMQRLKVTYAERPRWEKISLAAILILTTILYGIGASKNGYGNSFYAAAVQAGTHSWKAFFFGSLDSSSFITVDKPPFALWVMEISTRIFGFHTWSMLLPEVLSGTATVALVYATIRRWFSAKSATLAAAVMALSPVAVLMFGFDNPDAVLTLVLTASMYTFVRAIEGKNILRWLSLTAVFTGFAFDTKMLQGLLVLPVFAVLYLCLAPPKFMVRFKHLLFAIIPTAIAALWWPTIVSLIPAANRPYVGSSSTNNIWNLIFGYNGFGRLFGTSTVQGGHQTGFGGGFPGAGAGGHGVLGGHGGPGGSGFGGSTGVLRMFNNDFGPNIGWFIIASLLGVGLVIWLTRRAARADRTRIAVLAWGGWLIMHIIIFSMVSGVIHPYYPVVMTPAIAALIGITVPLMIGEYRKARGTAFVLPIAVLATGITASIALSYQTTWMPWLRWTVLIAAIASSVGLLINLIAPWRRLAQISLIVAALACGVSPTAYALVTASVAHTGSVPSAGPEGTGLQGSNNETSSAEKSFVTYLEAHRGSTKWLVAVASANVSAPIQLTSGQPVMAVGGFDGSDNALTVAQLKQLITAGELRYYAVSTGNGGGFGGRGGGMGGNSSILTWVEAHGTKVTYGGTQYTLYDLKS